MNLDRRFKVISNQNLEGILLYIYLASGITLEKFWEFQSPINPLYLKIFPLWRRSKNPQ